MGNGKITVYRYIKEGYCYIRPILNKNGRYSTELVIVNGETRRFFGTVDP